MTSEPTDRKFTNDDAAREHLESIHWPDGPICPHCGEFENVTRLHGDAHRPGVVQCNSCREQFTVTVGTVLERSKIPLHKWVYAMHLLCSSKKGMSAHQLHRMLGISYKSAWFMAHRLREALRDPSPEGMGGSGKVVEADETYFGDKDVVTKRTKRGKSGLSGKRAVLGLVERGGKGRMIHVHEVSAENVANLVRRNLSRESRLMTDESRLYNKVGEEFARHQTVTHSANEYVRDDVHTNTIEGYFSVFKRGMQGIYQHCGEAHLHRYLSEFDFRYNHRTALGFNDAECTLIALAGIKGKRLTYRRPD
jgi:transposase-like protein